MTGKGVRRRVKIPRRQPNGGALPSGSGCPFPVGLSTPVIPKTAERSQRGDTALSPGLANGAERRGTQRWMIWEATGQTMLRTEVRKCVTSSGSSGQCKSPRPKAATATRQSSSAGTRDASVWAAKPPPAGRTKGAANMSSKTRRKRRIFSCRVRRSRAISLGGREWQEWIVWTLSWERNLRIRVTYCGKHQSTPNHHLLTLSKKKKKKLTDKR